MLRYIFRNRHRNMPKAEGVNAEGHGSGPQGRINKMRKLVTALVRHERIEGYSWYMDEARGYAERLIQEAQKHGDTHKETMVLADYWLLEKDLIPKLFKVLVPRYSTTQYAQTSATQYWPLPTQYPGSHTLTLGILELKGNPWPPVIPHTRDIRGSLVNVLVEEAKKAQQKKRDLELTVQFREIMTNVVDVVPTSDQPTAVPQSTYAGQSSAPTKSSSIDQLK